MEYSAFNKIMSGKRPPKDGNPPEDPLGLGKMGIPKHLADQYLAGKITLTEALAGGKQGDQEVESVEFSDFMTNKNPPEDPLGLGKMGISKHLADQYLAGEITLSEALAGGKQEVESFNNLLVSKQDGEKEYDAV